MLLSLKNPDVSSDSLLSGVFSLGLQPYLGVRRMQLSLVEKRRKGQIGDTLLVCEHPRTVTLGKRCSRYERKLVRESTKSTGIRVFDTDRGGLATCHMPGQLVLYPVVSLRESGVGVRKFVDTCLVSVAKSLESLGYIPKIDSKAVGVWLKGASGDSYKVCSMGLRIINGISNHGIALNINCCLDDFKRIEPCGLTSDSVGSLELVSGDISNSEIIRNKVVSELANRILV